MKFFIVFTAILACAFAQTAYLADTAEVALAKADHFAQKVKAAQDAGIAPDATDSYYNNYYKSFYGGAASLAPVTVLSNGYLADTPEVAAAKATFFAEQAKAYAAPIYNFDYYRTYAPVTAYNPYAIPAASTPTVLPNGYLADTPEVAAAKASFLHEQQKAALASAPATPVYNYDYYRTYAPVAAYNPAYAIPAASTPTVLPNGYLADTPEVAAAKASFLHEQQKAALAAAPGTPTYVYDYTPAPAYAYRTFSYASPYAYSPSDVTVLPNGYLADTPEVAAAKAAHIAEFNKASLAATSPYYSDYYTWNGSAWVANQ